MKIRLLSATLTLLLLVSMLAGCTATANIPDDTQVPLNDSPEASQINTVMPPADASLYASPTPDQLMQAQAIEIALAHAGFSADEAQYLYAEYEIDDRIPQYDVQFYVKNVEYEYEIHAETGEILSYEQER